MVINNELYNINEMNSSYFETLLIMDRRRFFKLISRMSSDANEGVAWKRG